MRAKYVPPSDKTWTKYYTTQARQQGSGFIGSRYQRGTGIGSIFRSIFRTILPIVKSAGRSVGKQALRAGAEIASDMVAGEKFKKSASKRAKTAAVRVLKSAEEKMQEGTGLGQRSPQKGIKAHAKARKPQSGQTKFTDQLGTYYK